jgi:hypothetical protein
MDALTPSAGKPREVAAAKIRRAATESGIGPDDALAPLMGVIADAATEMGEAAERVEAAIDGMRDPLTPDQIRKMTNDIGSRMLNGSRLIERAANWRTAAVGAAALAVLGVLGWAIYVQGYVQGRTDARAQLVTSEQLSVALRSADAEWWRTLIVYNPSPSAAMRDCAVKDGRGVCNFAFWTEAGGPAPDPIAAEGKAPVRAHK